MPPPESTAAKIQETTPVKDEQTQPPHIPNSTPEETTKTAKTPKKKTPQKSTKNSKKNTPPKKKQTPKKSTKTIKKTTPFTKAKPSASLEDTSSVRVPLSSSQGCYIGGRFTIISKHDHLSIKHLLMDKLKTSVRRDKATKTADLMSCLIETTEGTRLIQAYGRKKKSYKTEMNRKKKHDLVLLKE